MKVASCTRINLNLDLVVSSKILPKRAYCDAVRPSKEVFSYVLEERLKTWSSYLDAGRDDIQIPRQAIDLKSLVNETPRFLADGIGSIEEPISFACEEKQSAQRRESLLINGRSTWRTSGGICDLPPKVLPKSLPLAVSSRLSVTLSENAPLSDWPGVRGLTDYDTGNFLSVLYFAWAYILSARWVYTSEVLKRPMPQPDNKHTVHVDIGDNASEEEILWWRAILIPENGWDATAKYNGHVYLSPWSISVKKTGLTLARKPSLGTRLEPLGSTTALEYLSHFCVYHRLYAQCSVALAGALYILFMRGKTVSLPLLKQPCQLRVPQRLGGSSLSISNLLTEHTNLLSKYMTLSCNIWGLRSLLYSTFFNLDIECNLVSAWLNPAFAVLDSISSTESSLATLLTNRQPRLRVLWLGAIFTDVAGSVLRDIRVGMAALDLPASAWAGAIQTFLTSKMEGSDGESIRREDECRLLFITASEGHDRPPVWPWKPFGDTQFCDADIAVRQHAQCAVHCLEYESWQWILSDNRTIQDFRRGNSHADQGIPPSLNSTSVALESIYQHSWFDLEGTDEDFEDTESDVAMDCHVEDWLDGIVSSVLG
ncbi:hypothetical protein ASPZODRAFT_151975 [Penicilliopsis zonata CBS 506.65]|uniref:Uncharacterized protein n=1 Tax=Penicilliopsis zonata CBS 506.65 TaxID=1073090 RepID=A0A1L9SH76_9EURO|nr:hypothetical protein ASPZODRAFT_151975 [Penicilliopsis zonata CBS 506.65]OJJ46436.1 hypothetical protein ASPZODRAFT_151975 [Penicilliopsis zonata CBS 506.65]